jgi:hypothetical protein
LSIGRKAVSSGDGRAVSHSANAHLNVGTFQEASSLADQPPEGQRLTTEKLVVGVDDHVLVSHFLDGTTDFKGRLLSPLLHVLDVVLRNEEAGIFLTNSRYWSGESERTSVMTLSAWG